MKPSEELTKISEKLDQKFQNDFQQLTEKLTPSFQKEINLMQQEIQYLKNKLKNLFDENMKLKSQIEGIKEEMKPGNNHTPTAYNEANKILKSPETLAKIHQEHSETSN